MDSSQLILSNEERDFLADSLSSALKSLQVEEHRTDSLTYRERVTHDKDLLKGILAKLEAAQASRAGVAVGG